MKITPVYKNKIMCLPAEVVESRLASATADELKVLLSVIAAHHCDHRGELLRAALQDPIGPIRNIHAYLPFLCPLKSRALPHEAARCLYFPRSREST